MTQKTDVAELLHSIGIRLGQEARRTIVDDIAQAKALTNAGVRAARRRRDLRASPSQSRAPLSIRNAQHDEGHRPFEWDWPRTIDRDLVERLITLDFVDEKHSVLFRGPSGLGKTTGVAP